MNQWLYRIFFSSFPDERRRRVKLDEQSKNVAGQSKLYPICLLMPLLLGVILLYSWPKAATGKVSTAPPDIWEQTTPITPTVTTAQIVTDVAKPPLVGGRLPEGNPVFVQRPRTLESSLAPDALAINLWYGDTQRFGHLGNPQTWINLLGTVTGPNAITNLRFSVNGGAEETLTVGKDGLRLIETGDFNIEIPYTSLKAGANQVVIKATDSQNSTVTKTVTVTYTANQQWLLPYVADWATTSNIQDIAQVVDGKWVIENGMIRPTVLGYDRLINIGDINWQEYVVTVPMIVRGIDPAGYEGINNGPGVGLLVRWQGHFEVNGGRPRTGWQNLGALGWYRWYIDRTEGKQLVGYGGNWLGVNAQQLIEYNKLYMLKLSVSARSGQTAYYGFKMWKANEPEPAAWDIEGGGNVGEPGSGSLLLVTHYTDVSFGKVTIQPLGATVHTITTATDGNGQIELTPKQTTYTTGQQVTVKALPANGYKLLSWGGDLSGAQTQVTVTITRNLVITAAFTPVNAPTYTLSTATNGNGQIEVTPNQANYAQGQQVTVKAVPATGHKFVQWSGDLTGNQNPATLAMTKNRAIIATFEKLPASTLTIGNTTHGQVTVVPQKAQYDFGEQVTITAVPDAGYMLNRWGGDVEGNANPLVLTMTKNVTLQPLFTIQQTLFSEDFNTCVLNSTLWTFTDPVGDAGFRLDGRHLSITLPGGTEHDLWPGRDRAARLLQPTADVDLDIIAKFSTIPTQPYQVQGLLFSEDSNNWLRADFYSDGSKLYVFAATVDNGAVQIRIPQQIINPTGADLYLRVTRVADLWSQYYSFDGQQWTKSGSFTYSFVVRSAGLFAANAAGANSPPFTSTVDYFMNTAAPITDEDGDNLSLSVKVVGNGRVEPTPDKGEYSCGEVVTLTAVPDTGWSFAGWSGKVTTLTNPLVVNFGISDAITSTFTALPQYQVNVATTGEGNVGRMPEKATYEPGEAVTLVAAPAEGWLFDGWQGDVQSSDNPLVLTMNGDLAVTATFVERPLLRLYLPLIAKPQ